MSGAAKGAGGKVPRPTASRPTTTAPDAIALLKADHRIVEKLFKNFEKASDGAHRTKRKIVDKIIAELSVHAAVEEQFLYPAAQEEIPATADDVWESLEEHHVVKWLLSELSGLDPKNERFVAKVAVLIEIVRQHVREEESELFPQLRSHMGRARLRELGDQLERAKRFAPTHAHPRASDVPPGNLVTGTISGALDRARDKVASRL